MKVLIVEDNKELASSIHDYLAGEGYICELASTFDIAKDKLAMFTYDCILLDIMLPGGNGLAFDWGLIAGRSWGCPWILSGGLTAELLPEAVRISGAKAVDVSSGVESRPGEKDPAKIGAFLTVARKLG